MFYLLIKILAELNNNLVHSRDNHEVLRITQYLFIDLYI